MRWLTFRDEKIKDAYAPDTIHPRHEERRPVTATDKATALFVLSDAVLVSRHPYDRDPHSGSGNCWCGRDMSSKLHAVIVHASREL